jgi:hypothetical protein
MTQRVCAVSPPFARVAGVCWLKQRPVCWHVHVMCWCACAYGTIYDLLYCLWSNAVKRGQTHRMTKFRPVDCETKQPIRFDPGFISDTIYTGVFVALVSTVVVMTMHVRTFERAYALLAADGACPSPATHGAAGGADAPAPHTRPPPPHTHTHVWGVCTHTPRTDFPGTGWSWFAFKFQEVRVRVLVHVWAGCGAGPGACGAPC